MRPFGASLDCNTNISFTGARSFTQRSPTYFMQPFTRHSDEFTTLYSFFLFVSVMHLPFKLVTQIWRGWLRMDLFGQMIIRHIERGGGGGVWPCGRGDARCRRRGRRRRPRPLGSPRPRQGEGGVGGKRCDSPLVVPTQSYRLNVTDHVVLELPGLVPVVLELP